jgi:hypothetical protein
MADTTGRLERARMRLLEIEGDLERLRVDRELARREIELLSGSPQPAGSRTDRIVEILDRLGEATPTQISGQLDPRKRRWTPPRSARR